MGTHTVVGCADNIYITDIITTYNKYAYTYNTKAPREVDTAREGIYDPRLLWPSPKHDFIIEHIFFVITKKCRRGWRFRKARSGGNKLVFELFHKI